MEGRVVLSVYAVARTGIRSFVYDCRPDMEKMLAYVDAWSLYGRGMKKEADRAMDLFSKLYYSGNKQECIAWRSRRPPMTASVCPSSRLNSSLE